jgi:Type II secretion system (T2SS), protein G
MATQTAREGLSRRARSLTLALLVLACRDAAERSRDTLPDTIAPIGTGTELLLTRERLALIDGWIRASIARTGTAPASLDDVHPSDADAARYVPLERFLRDGWGRTIDYEYAPVTRSYELRSAGEDGTPRTADDVTLRASL